MINIILEGNPKIYYPHPRLKKYRINFTVEMKSEANINLETQSGYMEESDITEYAIRLLFIELAKTGKLTITKENS